MTLIDGVEDLVDTPSLFDTRQFGVLSDLFANGVRNFYDKMTVTVVGAVMLAGVNVMAAAPPCRGDPSFAEPSPALNAQDQWKASVAGLGDLISGIQNGARPALAPDLSAIATETLASVGRRSSKDVGAWANALASEDADLDD